MVVGKRTLSSTRQIGRVYAKCEINTPSADFSSPQVHSLMCHAPRLGSVSPEPNTSLKDCNLDSVIETGHSFMFSNRKPTGQTFDPGRSMTEIPSLDPVQSLRLATGHLHQILDQNLPLARANPTLEDCRSHLRVLSSWQLALTPWLSRVLRNEWSLALIAQDLAEFPDGRNINQPPSSQQQQLGLDAFRRIDDGSTAFCWGIAYVLEGSRLGGQVLHRRLSPALAPHPLRYLSNTPASGCSWPVMLAALRKNLDSQSAQVSGCKGAVAAFELLIMQFQLEQIHT